MANLFRRLLSYYGLSKEDYDLRTRTDSLAAIPDPFMHMDGFSSVISLIKKHIGAHDKIIVYGDYDVDGITSASILVLTLNKLKASCGFYIPSRYLDGYGLNIPRLEEIALKGYKLLICVDNGISAFKEIKRAKELGMDVIIIDHHVLQDQLPAADGIIHQFLGHYTSYNISAAFLALLVSYGLLGSYDPYLVALGGIGAISDMMPMQDANLILAKQALKEIKTGQYATFNYLLNGSPTLKIKPEDIGQDSISYRIISPLNAIGRVDKTSKVNNAVRFLTSENPLEQEKLYRFIQTVVSIKKARISSFFPLLKQGENDPSPLEIRLFPEVEEGLIGLLANREMYARKKPVLFFTLKSGDPSLLIGSARSPEDLDIYALAYQYHDQYLAFGGHKNAFGLTIQKSDYEKISRELTDAVKNSQSSAPTEKYILLEDDDFNSTTLDLISSFGPFGPGFVFPKLAYKASRSEFVLSGDGHHLFKRLINKSSVIWFSYDTRIDLLPLKERYFIGTLAKNTYLGKESIDFIVGSTEDIDKKALII